MKRLLITIFALSICSVAQAEPVVASAPRTIDPNFVFHKTTCYQASRIKLTAYFPTYEDAIKFGGVPCKICKPQPTPVIEPNIPARWEVVNINSPFGCADTTGLLCADIVIITKDGSRITLAEWRNISASFERMYFADPNLTK